MTENNASEYRMMETGKDAADNRNKKHNGRPKKAGRTNINTHRHSSNLVSLPCLSHTVKTLSISLSLSHRHISNCQKKFKE
jgi:hypothetical protein